MTNHILQWEWRVSPLTNRDCLITDALAVPVAWSCSTICQSARHKVKRLMLVDSSWTGARLPVETSGDLDRPEVEMTSIHDSSRTTEEHVLL